MWRSAIVWALSVVVALSGLAAERKAGAPEQIRLCVRNLSHELPRMRAAAARALAEIGGESAVEPLIESLTDSDSEVRLSAASALGHINQRPLLCVERLTKLLNDKDEHVRYAAQWAIGQFAEGLLQASSTEAADRQPIGRLLAAAAGVMAQTGAPESIQQRVNAAVNSLQHVDSPNNAAIKVSKAIDLEALVADFKAEDMYLQVRALFLLKDIEPKKAAQLIRSLAEIREESAVEWQLPEALAEGGRAIVPGLVEILQGEDEQARSLALDVLTEIESGGELALPQLNRILADKEAGEDEVEKAIITISNLGPAGRESVGLLAKVAVNSELSETVRAEALAALAAIGPDADSAAATIKRLLRRSEEPADVRLAAAKAVVRISGQRDDTVKLLAELIDDTDDTDLAAAFAALLGELGRGAASELPRIIKLLNSPSLDGQRRQDLVLAVGEMGYEAQPAVGTLLELLTDSEQSESVQVASALALGKIGPQAVRAMGELLRQPAAEIRATIARAMVAIGPRAEPAASDLIHVLVDEDEEDETRMLAAIALGKIAGPAQAAVPTLTRLLADAETDDQLRAMCAIAIGSIEPAAESALQHALRDAAAEVQVAAAYSLIKRQQDNSSALRERLVQQMAGDDAEEFAAVALADIGSEAVVPLCTIIFNPSSDIDHRLRCVEVLGNIGTPAISTLIGLLEKADVAEAAHEALARQNLNIVPMLVLAAESQTQFAEPTRETLRELVRGYYDGLGAGPDDLTWGQAHPLAQLGEGRAGRGGGKKIYRLGPPLAVMGKPCTEVIAKGFKPVKVFYGTNRKLESATTGPSLRRISLQFAAITALALCFGCLLFHRPKNMVAIAMTGIGLVAVAAPLAFSLPRLHSVSESSAAAGYGGEYSERVEMGVCEVTIPDIHEEGELEGPSLMRLEIKVDPERHIVLHSVQPLKNDAFFASLDDELNQKGRNVLVFVHGYNVSFTDAARRTAQMAADLKFPGAAVFYSWPSQAHWYKYRLDEKNVELSVEQLKSFLLAVAEQSHASTINLVAHSMGNRLLTGALKELDVSAKKQGALFNQVVLAAPDIDADVFKHQIAPAIVTKAHRVTLYASSKDLALYASRQFNSGDARAGDAGQGMVIVPGIETIDASAGDCSLLGHCYYGDSVSILHDIQQLLADHPARDRQFLHPVSRSPESVYWIYEPDGIASQPRGGEVLR